MMVNILLFLVGINFLHYGQLFLPLICLILFVDRRLEFVVNKPLVFVLLCLFAVAFYAFSYQLGFYSVMGFTLPMAYYIGSNIRHPSKDNVIKVIYLFAIAMGIHILLDFVKDLYARGFYDLIHVSSHYDIWTGEKISTTVIAVELDLLIAVFYYLLVHEKNKMVKTVGITVFSVGFFYCILLGRRTPILLFFACMLMCFVFDRSVSEKGKRTFIYLMSLIILFSLVLGCLYAFDLFGLRSVLSHFYIFEKIARGFSDNRFGIYFKAFSLLGKYPWGGQKISESLGIQIHELWIDVYDYAGVVPYILLLGYSLIYGMNFISAIRKTDDGSYRTILIGLLVCIFIQMLLEPVMTASSIFLIIVITIGTIVEKAASYEK